MITEVRILYVRNLMLSTSEEHLKEIFEGTVMKKDCIERVKKLRDYAFIHFRQREDAVKAMEKMNGCQIDGSTVEVVLAKPVDKNEYNARMARAKGLSQIINCNEVETQLTPTQNQLISQYPRVLNKVAVAVKSRGRGAAGSRSAGGTKNYYSTVTRQHPVEGHLYDITPGVHLTPLNLTTHELRRVKCPTQTLDSICQKNHWGSPNYDLFSAVQPDTTTSAECQFFLYKVTIPALFPHYFRPDKLCRTPEEAKVFAAEYCLTQLGFPVESSEITVRPGATTVYPGRPLPPSVPIPRDVQVSLSSTAPSYVMGNIIRMDDEYRALETRFTREGKGRRPDITPPPLVNKVLVQLWDIMLHRGYEQKKVVEWFEYLYGGNKVNGTDRLRHVMATTYDRARELEPQDAEYPSASFEYHPAVFTQYQ